MEPLNREITASSVTEKEPLFSLKNYFKPTSKNVIKWADIAASLGATISGSGFVTDHKVIGYVGLALILVSIIFQRLTKEEPLSTITRAVEDIQIEQTEKLEASQINLEENVPNN